ncbi:MAG: hypothetical protein HKN26_02925 [Acidimicrobiales bacterium]|nr:hypothetical protein [Acidimicrobiales bacterium]
MANTASRSRRHWAETRHLWILRLIAALLVLGAITGVAVMATQSVPLAIGAIYFAPIAVLVLLVTIESVFLPPR